VIDNSTIYTRFVPLYSISDGNLIFRYTVIIGDLALPLNIALTPLTQSSLFLNGGKILAGSDYPQTPANVTLTEVNTQSLIVSNVQIKAYEHPILLSITTDHPAGTYTTGEKITIFLHFSTPILVLTKPNLTLKTPTVNFNSPSDATMVYINSFNSTVSFLYTVLSGQSATPLSFNTSDPTPNNPYLTLNTGYFQDILYNIWTNITNVPVLTTLSTINIDTVQAYVLRVDSNNADGVYYPGQLLDIFVVFNKKICIIPGPFNSVPSLEVFVPYQVRVRISIRVRFRVWDRFRLGLEL
jgi:hypothetical protein